MLREYTQSQLILSMIDILRASLTKRQHRSIPHQPAGEKLISALRTAKLTVADHIYKSLSSTEFTGKNLGLLVLAVITENGPYYLVDSAPAAGADLVVGNSFFFFQPGKIIAANAAEF